MPARRRIAAPKPRRYAIVARNPIRRRKRRYRAPKQQNIRSRTTQNVEQSLRSSVSNRKQIRQHPSIGYALRALDHRLLACRLDPLGRSSSGGLSDGSGVPRIVYHYNQISDFSIGSSGGFIIKIMPTFPYSAFIKPNSTAAGVQITVGGVTVAQGANGINFDFGWVPMMINSGAPTSAPGLAMNTATNFSAARILSMGWKLTYTGTAAACSGIICVRSDPTVMSEDATNVNPISYLDFNTGITVFTFPGSSGHDVVFSSGTKPSVYTPESQQCRPEVGCHGTIRHNAREYSYKPAFGTWAIMRSSGVNTSSWYTVSSVNDGAINFCDPDFDSVDIVGTSIAPNASYRLETTICMEQLMPNTSVFVPFLTKPGPDNSATMKIADAYLANAPVSIPATESHFRRFMDAIAAGAPALGSVFGAQGMAVGAGISALTSAISQFVI